MNTPMAKRGMSVLVLPSTAMSRAPDRHGEHADAVREDLTVAPNGEQMW